MTPERKRLALLGSTGSIGRAVLEIAGAHPDLFEVVGLSAMKNVDLLAEQAWRFGARKVVLADEDLPVPRLPPGTVLERGAEALENLASAPDADLVINALVGASGLLPTVASVRAGKRLALANKESLVMAGDLIMSDAREAGSEILPVDSEHSSVFRCLRGVSPREVVGLTLTASGGPLRDLPLDQLAEATLAQVLAHPTWSMGQKVTVDSATLVNKAMEVIEARWLFGLPFDAIDVVVHRESIVHSLVRLADGSMLAHLGVPDMRVPVQFAMFHPEAAPLPYGACRLESVGTLSFAQVPPDRFPCFDLMVSAGQRGGTAPAVAAMADEVAVGAFVEGRIRFSDIAEVIRGTLEAAPSSAARDLSSVVAASEEAAEAARGIVRALAGGVRQGRA